MNIANMIKSWAGANSQQFVFKHISKMQTDNQGVDDTPIEPGRDYIRLWLSDMHLTKSRTWFQEWFPAVHATIKFNYANRQLAEISRITQPEQTVLGKGVNLNYELSPLVPFNGGTIEIQAGLMAMKGTNLLTSAIGVLENFNPLVAAPLSTATPIVRAVSDGLTNLLNTFNGGIHLSFHQSYSDEPGRMPAPGYYAVVLANPEQIKPDQLYVREDILHYSSGNNQIQPLANRDSSWDYMLFRIERQFNRRDWKFDYINKPLTDALTALSNGNEDGALTLKRAAKMAAFTSLDLSEKDRTNILQAIDVEFNSFKTALGAVPQSIDELGDRLSARALSNELISAAPATLADLN